MLCILLQDGIESEMCLGSYRSVLQSHKTQMVEFNHQFASVEHIIAYVMPDFQILPSNISISSKQMSNSNEWDCNDPGNATDISASIFQWFLDLSKNHHSYSCIFLKEFSSFCWFNTIFSSFDPRFRNNSTGSLPRFRLQVFA